MAKRRIPEKLTAPERVVKEAGMFKSWFLGSSMSKVAEEFGMKKHQVWAVSQRDDWMKKRAKLYERLYANAMKDISYVVSEIMNGLKEDLIARRLDQRSGNKKLSIDDQKHFRALGEMFLKEKRLEDGRPTEQTSGIVEHRITLPPGVTKYGMMPPAKNVTIINTKLEDKSKTVKEDESLYQILEDSDDGGDNDEGSI